MKNPILIAVMVLLASSSFAQGRRDKVKFQLEFQKASDDRIVNEGNSSSPTYKIHVKAGDKVFNGNRAEIAVKFNNLNNHTYNYSWDFNIDGSYQQSELKFYHFIIAQWWNGPAKGQTMDQIVKIQGPPLYFVVVKVSGQLHLQVYYGLQNKNRQKVMDFVVATDKWIHVNNEVHWATDTTGYAHISIGERHVDVVGANKYNVQPNDFKVGLYRNMNNADDTQIQIRNIDVQEVK